MWCGQRRLNSVKLPAGPNGSCFLQTNRVKEGIRMRLPNQSPKPTAYRAAIWALRSAR